MTYGKEYKILKNFNEPGEEEHFETELINLCKKDKSALFIDNQLVEYKEE